MSLAFVGKVREGFRSVSIPIIDKPATDTPVL
ncbi:hypothetical protein Pla110_39420 [Polystyrenella longa]|uniref:Uncharacterized protein n=1 Tax=Polystyrenella longa TaxID=2528007 RepID=A0A518CSH8_9PLAN|nr:hypothetical protein Pla110_39420 [Polystyrenella longa]